MPPPLAAALSLILTALLVWWDSRRRTDVSTATWIPTIWLLLLGSRAVVLWLNLGTPPEQLYDILEGSPEDRAVLSVLILCALVVLIRRQIPWGSLLGSNAWFLVFVLYCLVSIVWSDFPFVSFKRWVKALGDPLIVLVLLTERNQAGAIVAVLRRCAFFLIPLSVVFVKYFPDYGRTYDAWSGEAMYTGVTTNKNLLGYHLFVFGLFFICTWTERKRIQDRQLRRIEMGICALLLVMIVYLVSLANSQTAMVALVVSSLIAIAVRSAGIRRHIGVIAILILAGIGVVMTTNLSGAALAALGRDATLTGRTDLWAAVLPLAENPLIGAGFESFWLGPRIVGLWERFNFQPNQAHNGYIEIYLNLGIVGLTLFSIFLLSSFGAVRRALHDAYSQATIDVDRVIVTRFGIGFVIAILGYNITEATFKSMNLLFVLLLLVAMRYQAAPVAQVVRRRPGLHTSTNRLHGGTPRWVNRRKAAVRFGGRVAQSAQEPTAR